MDNFRFWIFWSLAWGNFGTVFAVYDGMKHNWASMALQVAAAVIWNGVLIAKVLRLYKSKIVHEINVIYRSN